eukprot:Clim_evm46s157 gene=Clim_evmTU46s157
MSKWFSPRGERGSGDGGGSIPGEVVVLEDPIASLQVRSTGERKKKLSLKLVDSDDAGPRLKVVSKEGSVIQNWPIELIQDVIPKNKKFVFRVEAQVYDVECHSEDSCRRWLEEIRRVQTARELAESGGAFGSNENSQRRQGAPPMPGRADSEASQATIDLRTLQSGGASDRAALDIPAIDLSFYKKSVTGTVPVPQPAPVQDPSAIISESYYDLEEVRQEQATNKKDNRPWLRRGMSRSDAVEKLVGETRDGTFLIRESETQPGSYALSLLLNGSVRHFRIEGIGGQFAVGHATFSSLDELVDFFKLNALYTDAAFGPVMLTEGCTK